MKFTRILLVGNPNVGKSAIFFRLTGTNVMISNYAGSTVEYTCGKMKFGEEFSELIDAPGTYSLDPNSEAERVTVRLMKWCDLIVNVVDSVNLERNLCLTLQLLETGIPIVVAMNMWDEARHNGILIDFQKIEEHLGVPIVSVCGITGEGIKELLHRLSDAKNSSLRTFTDVRRWELIGKIIGESQKLSHRKHTFLEKLEDMSIRPVTGLLMALGILVSSFYGIFFVGENLVRHAFGPLFQKFWEPLMNGLSGILTPGTFLHHFLIGDLIGGKIDFVQSFGLLTTGFYVPIAMVLPYVFSFYFLMGLLEDFGYLPRLAVLLDRFVHPLGLHGYALIPMVLGLGCKVPGILAIRGLEGRREKFIVATLMTLALPCMTQTAMIVGLVGPRGGRYVGMIFLILFFLLVVKGLILNKWMKEESPEILIEIPPFRIPQIGAVLKKLWMRLYDAIPMILLGVLIANLLYVFHIANFLGSIFSPILTGLWGLPREAIPALMIGFLKKDVAIASLAPLNLTTKQLIISCVILTIYFPCVAAFATLVRELGTYDTAKIIGIVVFVSLLLGTFLNWVL